MTSEDYQEQQWFIRREEQAHEALAFLDRFIREARNAGVPLYCREMHGARMRVFHCQWEDSLNREDWEILAQFGHIASGMLRYLVEWEGDAPIESIDPFSQSDETMRDYSIWRVVGPRQWRVKRFSMIE